MSRQVNTTYPVCQVTGQKETPPKRGLWVEREVRSGEVAGADEGHGHPLLVEQHGHTVPFRSHITSLRQRIRTVTVADRDDPQIKGLGATQGNRAVGFLTDDDQRIHVDVGAAGRDATGAAYSRTAVGERDQFGRHDETELLEGADFVLVQRLAGAVSRNRGVAREGGGVP